MRTRRCICYAPEYTSVTGNNSLPWIFHYIDFILDLQSSLCKTLLSIFVAQWFCYIARQQAQTMAAFILPECLSESIASTAAVQCYM